jgi:hypothetical protein
MPDVSTSRPAYLQNLGWSEYFSRQPTADEAGLLPARVDAVLPDPDGTVLHDTIHPVISMSSVSSPRHSSYPVPSAHTFHRPGTAHQM